MYKHTHIDICLYFFRSSKNQKFTPMSPSPTQHHRCQSAFTIYIFVNLFSNSKTLMPIVINIFTFWLVSCITNLWLHLLLLHLNDFSGPLIVIPLETCIFFILAHQTLFQKSGREKKRKRKRGERKEERGQKGREK